MAQYGEDFKVFLLCWYSNFDPIKERDIARYLADRDYYYHQLQEPFTDHRYWKKKLDILELNSPFNQYPPCVIGYMNTLDLEPSFITDAVVIKDNPIYHEFVNMQTLIARGSVKHKELQDNNLIYCYGKYNESEKR